MANMIFGKFFWIWIVTFLVSASYLSAQSVINLRQLWLPRKNIITKSKSEHSQAPFFRKHADVITGGQNIFDANGALVTPIARPTPAKTTPEKQAPKPEITSSGGCPPRDPANEMKESKIQATLKGTSYVDEDPSMSMAAVIVKVKIKKKRPKSKKYRRRRRYYTRTVRQVEMFRPGDVMMAAKLCSIERKRIIIYYRGKFETLTLYKKKKNFKNWLYGGIGLGGPSTAKGPGEVKIRDGDKFVISRKTVNNWLANPMQYAMSARIMPERGIDGGFRLVWIRKGSLYSQIGLKSGDVVRQVNGKKLSAGSALDLYSKLPYAKSLRVSVVRKGVRRTLLYNIK